MTSLAGLKGRILFVVLGGGMDFAGNGRAESRGRRTKPTRTGWCITLWRAGTG